MLHEILPSKNVSSGDNITFIKDANDNIEGFSIRVRSSDRDKAEKISKKIAANLERILTIKSGMTVQVVLSHLECKEEVTGHKQVGNLLTVVYGIGGGLNELDLTNPNIQKLLNSFPNFNLSYLSRALHHFYMGHTAECIKEAFKVIEGNPTFNNYLKYKCIRNILSHTEQQRFKVSTATDFDKYFGLGSFDLKRYDPSKGEIVIDYDSDKTKRTLFALAKDLVKDARAKLNL